MTEGDRMLAAAEMQFNDVSPLTKKEINLESLLIHPDSPIEKEHPIIIRGEIPIMTEKNISVLVGLPKCRKTFFVSALAAAFFDECLGMKAADDVSGSVLIMDTEQSAEHTQRVVKRIYQLLGWDFTNQQHKSQLRVLATREYSVDDRLTILEKAIETFSPTFVVLDGISDIIHDTNKLDECTQTVQTLMRLSSIHRCHISTVLHTNPNSEKARGHVGSELQRKAETMMLLSKTEDVTTVSPQYCRDIEFNKFSFRIDCHGLPAPCDYTPTPTDSNRILFESIFIGEDGYRYTDLSRAVMSKCGIKETQAYNRIKRAKESGIIHIGKDNLYHLNDDSDSDESGLMDDDQMDDLPE